MQEAVIVTKDIFRRYPGKYEGTIPKLCEHLDSLDEPESKAAIVWIIGQFADKIDNADELLEVLVDTFLEESVEVGVFANVPSVPHSNLSIGATCPSDSLCQVVHIQVEIRDGQEFGAQDSEMGDRRSRQP